MKNAIIISSFLVVIFYTISLRLALYDLQCEVTPIKEKLEHQIKVRNTLLSFCSDSALNISRKVVVDFIEGENIKAEFSEEVISIDFLHFWFAGETLVKASFGS